MTADKVRASAKAAGYELTREQSGDDWKLAMKKATAGNNFLLDEPRNGVGEDDFKKGGETLMVTYIAMPQGSVVKDMSYFAGEGVLGYDAAVAEMTRRYGKSRFGHEPAPRWAGWCSGPGHSALECNRYSSMTVSDHRDHLEITSQDATEVNARRMLLGLDKLPTTTKVRATGSQQCSSK